MDEAIRKSNRDALRAGQFNGIVGRLIRKRAYANGDNNSWNNATCMSAPYPRDGYPYIIVMLESGLLDEWLITSGVEVIG